MSPVCSRNAVFNLKCATSFICVCFVPRTTVHLSAQDNAVPEYDYGGKNHQQYDAAGYPIDGKLSGGKQGYGSSRGWPDNSSSNSYNDRPRAPYTSNPKLANPYDDPDRMVRRDQRRNDYHKKNVYNKGYDDGPADTYMGGDDSPTHQHAGSGKRGPRTPDPSRDPLGLSDTMHKPHRAENRFMGPRRRREPKSANKEDTSGAKNKKGFLEEQRLMIEAMTKGLFVDPIDSQEASDPFPPSIPSSGADDANARQEEHEQPDMDVETDHNSSVTPVMASRNEDRFRSAVADSWLPSAGTFGDVDNAAVLASEGGCVCLVFELCLIFLVAQLINTSEFSINWQILEHLGVLRSSYVAHFSRRLN